jgi:hypothetical protein
MMANVSNAHISERVAQAGGVMQGWIAKGWMLGVLAIGVALGPTGRAAAQDAVAVQPVTEAVLERAAPEAAVQPAPDSTARTVGRVILTPLASWALGALAGGTLAGVGGLAADCFGFGLRDPACGPLMAGGGFVGLVAGVPLGAVLVNDLFGGRGSFLGALLGTLAGTALAGAIFAASWSSIVQTEGGGIGPMIALSFLPAIGATVALELEGL